MLLTTSLPQRGCLQGFRKSLISSTAPFSRRACSICAIAAPVRERVPESEAGPCSPLRIPDAVPASLAVGRESFGAAAPSVQLTGRVVVESPDELKSTWEHRAWVGGASLLLACTLGTGLAQVDGAGSVAASGASVLAAYVAADFGSAVYHFLVDNYGDAQTPLVGGQILAFQGHHQRPWTITEREPCNNLYKVFQPATPVAALLLAAAPNAPAWWNIGASTFFGLICLSQQFHAWSHMKRSELPAVVVALQEAGLLISRKDHGAHHRAPFSAKYSIVSGWLNPLMDRDCPENSVWRKVELLIRDMTGVEPRSWHDPEYGWAEQERPGS